MHNFTEKIDFLMMKTQLKKKRERKNGFSHMKEYQHYSGGFCLICETHHSILSDHVHKTENYGQDFLVYEK